MISATPNKVFGPYAVEATLGAGGMGVVYRARDTRDGSPVALKALRLARPYHLAAFRREVHVLARLQHPAIVRIVDHGLTRGVPWYAMDLVEGQTFAQAFEHSGIGRLGKVEPVARTFILSPVSSALPPAEDPEVEFVDARPPYTPRSTPSEGPRSWLHDVLDVTRQICGALAFLHAHGIIHRDLKPANVLIRADGTPVLVDFGIVARFAGGGREVLDYAEATAGTRAYMAPEQRIGRFVDARTDLFSLGCMLYECVTGELPYGQSGLSAFSHAEPRPPSGLSADVPAELDTLIMRLLAKNARDRIGYADDVEAMLSRILSRAEASRPSRRTTYLYRAEFACRQEPFHRFEQALAGVLSGNPLRGLITGESGVGKTRLVMELMVRAAEMGMTAIAGGAEPVDSEGKSGGLGAPLHPLRGFLTAVLDACRSSGHELTERLMGGRAAVLAPYEPALAQISGEGIAAAPALSAEAARSVLFASLKGLLVEFAFERPLLLALDDLQWADDLTLEFLEWLDLSDVMAPLAIIGAFRIEEAIARHQNLAADPRVVHESLGRFDRAGVEQIVGGMLGLRAPPQELVDFVYRQSSGNPLFVAEYLRAAIGDGMLLRDGAGRWELRAAGGLNRLEEIVAAPPSMTFLVAQRLDRLDDVSARALNAAAVLGRGFDVDLVARAADLDAVAVLDAYGVLRQRQILEEDSTGTIHFVHDLLRNIAYSAIDPARLPECHRRAAIALEERYTGNDLDPYLGPVAYHLAKAGDFRRAAELFERAGDRSRQRFAHQDAIRFYRLSIAELEKAKGPMEVGDRARLEEAIGDLLILVGDIDEARRTLSLSLELTPSGDGTARARRGRKVATAWELQHHHVKALEQFEAAERELGPLEEDSEASAAEWHEWVQIQVDKVIDLYFLARTDDIRALFERTRHRIERHATPIQRARLFLALGQDSVRRDRYFVSDETLAYARACLQAAEQCDDIQELTTAQFFHGFMLVLADFVHQAEPVFATAVAGAERVGDAPLQSRVLAYYALLHRRLGRVEETRNTAERALAMATRSNMLDYMGVAEAHLAWVDWICGDDEATQRHAEAALSAWRKLPPGYVYPLQWMARVPLAAVLTKRGRSIEAVEQWSALLGTGQNVFPQPLHDGIVALAARDTGDEAALSLSSGRLLTLAQDLRFL